MAYSGSFKIKNPKKYKGDSSNITYRSLWELSFMKYLDAHKEVLQWSSEEIIVPYNDPMKAGKRRRYYPDFYVLFINKQGKRVEWLVEIKPDKQTREPKPFSGKMVKGKPKGKGSRRFLREVVTYGTNMAKWEAAEKYSKKQGWKFVILTEKDLGQYTDGK